MEKLAKAYFFIIQRGKEDIAGGVALGLFMIFIAVVVATAAAVFEKRFQPVTAEGRKSLIVGKKNNYHYYIN